MKICGNQTQTNKLGDYTNSKTDTMKIDKLFVLSSLHLLHSLFKYSSLMKGPCPTINERKVTSNF